MVEAGLLPFGEEPICCAVLAAIIHREELLQRHRDPNEAQFVACTFFVGEMRSQSFLNTNTLQKERVLRGLTSKGASAAPVTYRKGNPIN